MKRCATVLAAVVLCLGCGYVETSRVITGPPGPPFGGQVGVFMETAPPPPQFVEVAILQTIGYGLKADLANVVGGK